MACLLDIGGLKIKYLVRYPHRNGVATYHAVPVEDVWLLPKHANMLVSADVLSDLLYNGQDDHQLWSRHLKYGAVAVLRGVEGLQIFTTFKVQDHPNEERILHAVPSHIVESAIAAIPYVHKCGQYENGAWNNSAPNTPILANHARRVAIYEWTREIDMPTAMKINPYINGWPLARDTLPVSHNVGSCARIDRAEALRAEAEALGINVHALAALPREVAQAAVDVVAHAIDVISAATSGGVVPIEDRPLGSEPNHDDDAPGPHPAPEPPSVMVLVRKTIVFRGQNIVVRGRGPTHAEAMVQVNQRIAQARAHLTRLASDNTNHLTAGEAREHLVPAMARKALRDAEAELFDLKHTMPENTYLRIANAFKRTFDEM